MEAKVSHPFQRVKQGDHPQGGALYDHTAHTDLHQLPEGAQPPAEDFSREWLKAPQREPPINMSVGGISPKRFIALPGKVNRHTGAMSPERVFMVKPYFENLDWSPAFYPLSGFSEMATQELFHAAGIGDLNHKVHTFVDQVDGHDHPFLGVYMEPGVHEMREFANSDDPVRFPQHLAMEALQMGTMDYLTNHQDRHMGNLMVHFDPVKKEVQGLFGVDNGRSFQYRQGNRFNWDGQGDEDHPFYYFKDSPGISMVLKKTHGNQNPTIVPPTFLTGKHEDVLGHPGIRLALKDYMQDLLVWWASVRDRLPPALEKHLRHFRDEDAANWIRDNFMERMKVMDRWLAAAHEYHQAPIFFFPGVGGGAMLQTKMHYNWHGEHFVGHSDYADTDPDEPGWDVGDTANLGTTKGITVSGIGG